MSELDLSLAWRTAIISLVAIWAVILASFYQIITTMESEHELAIDEEKHLESVNE